MSGAFSFLRTAMTGWAAIHASIFQTIARKSSVSILHLVSDLIRRKPDTPGTLRRSSVRRIRTCPLLLASFATNAGATAIEYGLIAAGISVAIIATVAGLGTKLKSTFTSVDNALN